MKSKRGVTLIEVMLAGAILALLSIALFNGIAIAARIAHENAETLSAEAVVWDAVWKKFNEDYTTIKSAVSTTWTEESLSSNAAPALAVYGTGAANLPKLKLRVSGITETLCCIEGDLEWGPSSKRRLLSDICPVFVYRGELGRVVSW